METAVVEEVAASLVREFLSKKGLKKTSAVMDEEFPRTALSINNRNELRNVLNLQSLYKQNKVKDHPLKTLLEIMTSYFLECTCNIKGIRGNPLAPTNKASQATSKEKSLISYCLPDGAISRVALPEKSKMDTPSFDIIEAATHPAGLPRWHLHKKNEKSRIETVSSTAEGEKKLVNYYGDSQTPEQSLGTKTTMRENLQTRPGGPMSREITTGPENHFPEDSLKRKHLKLSPRVGNTASFAEEDGPKSLLTTPAEDSHRTVGLSKQFANLLSSHSADSLDLNQNQSPKPLFGPYTSTNGEIATMPPGELFAKVVPDRSHVEEKKPTSKHIKEKNRKSTPLNISQWQMSAGNEKQMGSYQKSEIQLLENRKTPASTPRKDCVLRDTLELVDVEDEETVEEVCKIPVPSSLYMLEVTSKPIDFFLARDLKTLLFGTSLGCFSEEWKIQSFAFNDSPLLKYGIVQKKGGPCGVLAAVQASVLRHLIYGDSSKDGDPWCLQPSQAQRTKCLILALADILWRAGGNKKAVVTLHTEVQQFIPAGKYKADGIMEMLMLHFVTKYEDLLMFLEQNIHQFEVGPHGCILLTLSAILSRSINQVCGDFDVRTNRLIGAHGYCTQELVNLLLTGKAVSNVFNDMMELDSGDGKVTVLRGITGRSEIGLLSLFEHYDVCKVGCYLKTPIFPIWLVCSESHFSVLFCLRKDLLGDWKVERRFDLLYYDGLANQQEEIRLTIDTSQPYVEDKGNDLIPPLEHCIRTKWKGAVVSWNGTEPIL